MLVADDDAQQVLLRCMLLEASGYEVQTAVSVAEVHRRLAERVPDVLLMDLRFANVQGEPDAAEGLALIREVHERVAVIVISGWPQELEGRPEAEMAVRVLPKPCRLETMLAAIEAAVVA